VGQVVQSTKFNIGFLPEERSLPKTGTVRGVLSLWAELRGLKHKDLEEQVSFWLAKVDLLDVQDEKLSTLSKGNQQKLQLACCLIHKPGIAIFDEPFSGLDPSNQELVINLLYELKELGSLIIISAHQLELIERMCDEFFILINGKLAPLSTRVKPTKLEYLSFTLLSGQNEITAFEKYKCDGKKYLIPVSELSSRTKVELLNFHLEGYLEIGNIHAPSLREHFVRVVESGDMDV
jgi:ABC-2 type transport system ATP-binding protein